MWKCTKCGTSSENFELECRNCGFDKEMSNRKSSKMISENNDEGISVDRTYIYETDDTDEKKGVVKRNKNKVGSWVDSVAGVYLILSCTGALIVAFSVADNGAYGEFEVGIFMAILFISAISIFLVYLVLRVVSEVLHLLQKISDNTSEY